MITIIIILSVVLITSLYVVFNLLRKAERQEDIIINQNNYINSFSEAIEYISFRLNEIDEKGIFKADDEIGWFFDEVKKINVMLNEFILKENGKQNQENP